MKNIITNNLDLPDGNIDHTYYYRRDKHYFFYCIQQSQAIGSVYFLSAGSSPRTGISFL